MDFNDRNYGISSELCGEERRERIEAYFRKKNKKAIKKKVKNPHRR